MLLLRRVTDVQFPLFLSHEHDSLDLESRRRARAAHAAPRPQTQQIDAALTQLVASLARDGEEGGGDDDPDVKKLRAGLASASS